MNTVKIMHSDRQSKNTGLAQKGTAGVRLARPAFKYLRPGDISAIERAVAHVKPCGEVHLIVTAGRLSDVRTVVSQALVSREEATPSTNRE